MEAHIERGQLLAITRLYDAALKGDVPSLLHLLGEDPLILDRCIIGKSGSFMQSPLHLAANFGHVNFTEEIIKQKPELVELVDQIKRSSPLHIASAKGNLQIVEILLTVNPSICYTHDQDGKTPVHVAAINGQIEVLTTLLKVEPQAAWERTIGGDTVLHLCVKHKQPKALSFLVKTMDDGELLNFDDAVGNTVLHLAVAAKQSERSRKDGIQDEQLWQHLNRANALPAKEALKPKKDRAWLEDQRTSLMVVASLIATMAFQAGINPPGGVWQDDTGHVAGTAIWTNIITKCRPSPYQRPSIQAIFLDIFKDNLVDFCLDNSVYLLVLGEENTSEKDLTLFGGSELTNEVVKEGGVVQCNEQIIVPIMSTNLKDIVKDVDESRGRIIFLEIWHLFLLRWAWLVRKSKARRSLRQRGLGGRGMLIWRLMRVLVSFSQEKRKAGVQFTGELMEKEGYTLKRVKGNLDSDELSVFNQVAGGGDVQPREEQ
uniref:PGG domain-containing protein n=1 Tax=Chenopodium quinoa TaxID=63459 RepID=A0A803N870_CHEQI